MKIRWLIIFFVFLTFLLSVGGVFSQDINDNVTNGHDITIDDAVLTDTSHENNQNQDNLTKTISDDTLDSFDVKINDSQNSSCCTNQKHNHDDGIASFEQLLKTDNDFNFVLGDRDSSVVYDRVIIVNGDFEESTIPVGWDYSGVSVYTYQHNAQNGKRYLSLNDNAFISQNVNLDTVDFISFWYKSENRNSHINVLFDDVSFLDYTIQNPGKGIWEQVLLDVSNMTGFHTFKVRQKGTKGFVDNFNIIHNSDIYINFTLTSFSLVGGNLTLSFNDWSFGLISGWLWDFGDGTTSTSQNATHSFKTGHYTISLKVSNENTTKIMYYTLPITLPTIESTGIEYGSIQEAINSAVTGDTINIPNTIFYSVLKENIVIDKSLTLNFNNCSLLSHDSDPVIMVRNNADVLINNISLGNNTVLKTDDSSKLTLNLSNLENLIFDGGNFEITCNILSGSELIINNAYADINNCNFTNSRVIANGSKSRIFNNSFSDCDVAITQIGGELSGINNVFHNNAIGVNVTDGTTDLSFNTFYENDICLVFNSSAIVYEDNWWGKNNPTYIYSPTLVDCDICQLGGNQSSLKSWIVLNITQSSVLDYEYYIAGVTYYNLTFDLTHNNLGEDISKKVHFNDLTLHISNIDEYIYYEHPYYQNPPHYGNAKKILTTIVSKDVTIVNGKNNSIFSLGYLTSDWTMLNLTILNENYTVLLKNNTIDPYISYITPCTVFNDALTVEMECVGEDAIVFYTLDGTNPGYSPTRLVYREPFVVNDSCTIHYCVIDKWGNFQKITLDTISHYGSHYDLASFIRQDVYVQLNGNGNIYYSLDGNKIDSTATSSFDGLIHYYHPFIIHGTAEINAYCQYYGDAASYYSINARIYMYCYGYDFSVNYLKNISLNNSDAVWSQYQGNINNTGVTNATGPVTNQSFWNTNVLSSGSAVVDSKGRIVVGGSDGYLYYLNKLGQVIWRFGTTSRIICTPTIGADGNIYFSNWMNSSVYCISPEGQLIWKYNLGDYNTGTSPVFGLDNRLYVITSNGVSSNIYVFKDGVLLSNCTIPFVSGSTPVVSGDGSLYLISCEHELVILNFDGSLKQAKFMDSGDTIGSFYYSIDPQQNTQMSASMGDDGIIYVLNYPRSWSHQINAYYPDGTLKWSSNLELKDTVSGTPTYYNGTLYIIGNNKLVAVNASNGKILWNNPISTSGFTASSPLVSGNGIIYVASSNMVYAFNSTGDLIWQYKFSGGKYGNPTCFSSPTLTSDDALIVTTNQGIYAFRDTAADFTYEHVNNTETTVQFWDLSTNGTNRYYWMFGDGNFSREQNPVHAYASPGKYSVVLLVEHNGNVDLMRNKTIEVVFYDITPPSDAVCYINSTPSNGGSYSSTQTVALNATDDYSNVTIYYTIDSSNPLNSQTRKIYTGPFDIEVDTVLNMVACDSAGNYGNVTSLNFTITDAVKVNTALVDEIQALLDNAEARSKIFFNYPVINGANFTVNKPLNIISNGNTELIGNNNQPVFTFTENAGGSILNGFNINNCGSDGILINNAEDVYIRNCMVNVTDSSGINIYKSRNIQIKDTTVSNALDGIVINQSMKTSLDSVKVIESYNNGVWIYQSQDTLISNSLLESNGKDWWNSKANQVLIDDSINTKLFNNVINYGFFGIHLYHNTDGVVIDKNIINETSGDAILLSNSYSNVNITHNLIEGCYNGIDFMGRSENVTIKQNTIKLLHDHENDLFSFVVYPLIEKMAGYVYETYFPTDQFFNHRANGIQVSYPASNFDEGNTIIIDNVVIRLAHRSWEARKYTGHLNAGCDSYGYNLMDGSNSYNITNFGGATSYSEGKVDLELDRIGDATFRLRLINRLDNHYLSEIPEFDVIFRAGGFSQTVKFINDSAIATFDVSMAVSDVEAIISGEIRKSAHFDIPITEGYTSTNRAYDPGFERGEAYNNPDPMIPKIPPEEDDYKHDVNPVTPEPEPVIPQNPETGTGNGTGIGNGTGNGSSFGNGSGTGIGNGTGTGVGKGNGTTFNPNGGNPSDSAKSSSEVSPDGNAGSAGGSSGSEGSKAYEITKEIDIENTSLWSLVILLLAIFFFIVGWRREESKDDEL